MTPITLRIAIYYTVLALLPLLVNRCIAAFTYIMENQIIGQVPEHIYGKALAVLEWVFNNIFSVTIFSFVLPFVFGKVDRAARRYARKRYQQPLWWLKMPKHPNNPQSWSTWFRQRYYALQDGVFWSTSTSNAKKSNNTDHNSGGAEENEKDQKEAKDWQWTKWQPSTEASKAKTTRYIIPILLYLSRVEAIQKTQC